MVQVFNVEANAAQAIAEMARFNAALAPIGQQFERLTSFVDHYNNVLQQNGGYVQEYVGTTAKGFDAAGQAINAYINALNNLEHTHVGSRVAPVANVGNEIQDRLGGINNRFTQQGIINVQNATIALNKLQESSGLAQGRMLQLFEAIRQGNVQALGPLTTAELQAEVGIRKLTNAFNTANTAGLRTVNMMLNLQTAFRIFAIQQAHLIISKFTQSILQSVEAGKEYETRLAEIQTITQKANRSTQQWSGSLVALSNNFGTDLLKTTEAGYEAVSNQIAHGADVTIFLADAFKLARTTSATADEAVNILSSAINAYGTSAVNAERYSASLFKLADLGRVRVGQLANTFGNTATLAHQLGIDIDSLNASLATLTIQGIRPDTSMTLMNNIMLKLLKPTKEMTGLFKVWGVESGEAAIATFGFQGVLARLNKELETGGLARLAETGNDMRAIRALAALTGQSFEKYTENLMKMKDAQKEYDEAAKLTADTMAHKLNVEFAKLNNLFVADAAQRYNKILLEFAQNTGGLAENLKPLVDTGLNLVKIASDLASALINLSKNVGLNSVSISNLIPGLLTAYGTYRTLLIVVPALTAAYTFLSTRVILHLTALAAEITANGILIGTVNTLTASLYGLVAAEGAATFGLSLLAAAVAGTIAYYISTATQQANMLANVGADLEAKLNDQSQAAFSKLNRDLDEQNQILVKGLTDREQEFNKHVAAIRSILNSDIKTKIDDLLNPLQGLSNDRNFELKLIGASEESKLNLVTERIKELQDEIKILDQSGDLEGVEAKFKELSNTAKDFTTEAARGLDKINKELAKFDKDASNKQLEHQLAGLTDPKKIEKYKELIAQLRKESKDIVGNGGEEKLAIDKLDEAQKFADRLISLTGKNHLNPKKGGNVQGTDLEKEIQAEKRILLLQQQQDAEKRLQEGKKIELNAGKNTIDGTKLATTDMIALKNATIAAANAIKDLKNELDSINKKRAEQQHEEDAYRNSIVAKTKSLAANTKVNGAFSEFKNNQIVNSDIKIANVKDKLDKAIEQYTTEHGKDKDSIFTQEAYDRVIKFKNHYVELIKAANEFKAGTVSGPVLHDSKDIKDIQDKLTAKEKLSDETAAQQKRALFEVDRVTAIQDAQIAKVKELSIKIPGALEQFNKTFGGITDKLDTIAERLTKSGKEVIDALEKRAKEQGLIPQDRRGAFIPSNFTPQINTNGNRGVGGQTNNSIVNVGDINVNLSGNNTKQNARELAQEIRRAVRNGTVLLS